MALSIENRRTIMNDKKVMTTAAGVTVAAIGREKPCNTL